MSRRFGRPNSLGSAARSSDVAGMGAVGGRHRLTLPREATSTIERRRALPTA